MNQLTKLLKPATIKFINECAAKALTNPEKYLATILNNLADISLKNHTLFPLPNETVAELEASGTTPVDALKNYTTMKNNITHLDSKLIEFQSRIDMLVQAKHQLEIELLQANNEHTLTIQAAMPLYNRIAQLNGNKSIAIPTTLPTLNVTATVIEPTKPMGIQPKQKRKRLTNAEKAELAEQVKYSSPEFLQFKTEFLNDLPSLPEDMVKDFYVEGVTYAEYKVNAAKQVAKMESSLALEQEIDDEPIYGLDLWKVLLNNNHHVDIDDEKEENLFCLFRDSNPTYEQLKEVIEYQSTIIYKGSTSMLRRLSEYSDSLTEPAFEPDFKYDDHGIYISQVDTLKNSKDSYTADQMFIAKKTDRLYKESIEPKPAYDLDMTQSLFTKEEITLL